MEPLHHVQPNWESPFHSAVNGLFLVAGVSTVHKCTRIEAPHEAWRLRLSGSGRWAVGSGQWIRRVPLCTAHADGRVAHAMMVPRGDGADVVWLLDGKVQGGTTTVTWDEAVLAADRLRLLVFAEDWSAASNDGRDA